MNLVLCGRLRLPGNGGNGSTAQAIISLFFCVTRQIDDNKCNMALGYTEVQPEKVTLKMPHIDKEIVIKGGIMPSIPVMYNRVKLKKHERIVCGHDGDLNRIKERMDKKRVADLIKDKAKLNAEADAAKKAKNA